MSILSIVIGLVILGVVLYVVFLPVFRKAQDPAVASAREVEHERLEAEREAVYVAIRELDLDYQTGKITEDPYRTRREQLTQRGVEILQALDSIAER